MVFQERFLGGAATAADTAITDTTAVNKIEILFIVILLSVRFTGDGKKIILQSLRYNRLLPDRH